MKTVLLIKVAKYPHNCPQNVKSAPDFAKIQTEIEIGERWEVGESSDCSPSGRRQWREGAEVQD